MATINKTILIRQVRKMIFTKDMQDLAYRRAERILNKIKKETLKDFDDHVVTKELKGGISSENISETLPGTRSNANLFSFIGFPEGSEPTKIVRESLEQEIGLSHSAKKKEVDIGVRFSFKVEAPTLKSLEPKTPMPWESGRSWLRGIQRGISGLGYYLSGRFKAPEPSRSGGGIQSKRLVRSGAFSPIRYMGEIMEKFKEKIKGVQ